jgi:hypothetical protein
MTTSLSQEFLALEPAELCVTLAKGLRAACQAADRGARGSVFSFLADVGMQVLAIDQLSQWKSGAFRAF